MTYDNNDGPVYSVLVGGKPLCPTPCDAGNIHTYENAYFVGNYQVCLDGTPPEWQWTCCECIPI